MSGEDKSLDDFFAKKDRGKKGKSKGKGKFTTSSAITKQVEGSKKTVNEQTKEQKPSSGQTVNSQKEDEWLDFNEPKERDYSGLKVQSFQTLEKVDVDLDEEQKYDDEHEDGDDCMEKKEKSTSVWQPVAQPVAQVPVVEPPKEDGKKESVYVPPGLRRAATSQNNDQSWKYGSASSRRTGRPPEINSEVAFPSLSTTADVSTKSEAKASIKFETVKHGARISNEQAINRRTNIDLGNKFDALSK